MTQSKIYTHYDVRVMQAGDLAEAHQLSRKVGWPHRHEDWEFVFSLGQGLVAHSDQGLAATALWWRYDQRVTRIGMVIVDPTLQRSGLGSSLMQTIIARSDDPLVLLNATAQGETLYRRLGFVDFETIIQHQGASFQVPLVPIKAGERLRPVGRNDSQCLVALDAEAGGVPREAVINALLQAGEAVILDEAGEMKGFAFYRRFGRGYTIGPVVARDADAAKALIAHWLGLNPGMFIRIDIPEQSGLSPWLEELGLARVSQVRSMARGALMHTHAAFRIFGILNQALG